MALATRQRLAATLRPYCRVFLLARGGSDDAIETRVRRCPHCQSERIAPLGKVSAAQGLLKISHQCEESQKPFVYVRRPVDFAPPPDIRRSL